MHGHDPYHGVLRKRVIGYLLSLAFIGLASAMAFSSPASATCTVPYTLTNGQVADATQVMDNFNALGNCSVSTTGSPTAGGLSVFSGTKSVTAGDLTGDVTTSGSTATSLSATGVTPGTYASPTITVDSKGRISAATNGSAPGSGTETLIETWVTDGVATAKTFTLPGGFVGFRIEIFGANPGRLVIRCNGDASAIYQQQRIAYANGSGIQQLLSQSAWQPNNFALETGIINGVFRVHDYESTTRIKGFYYNGLTGSTGSGGVANESYSGTWNSTAALTSLVFTRSGGTAFIAGATFRLFAIQ